MYFPLDFRDAKEIDARFSTAKRPHHKACAAILRTIQPSQYKVLRSFSAIDNRDKHELPVLAAASHKKIVMRFPADVALNGKTGIQVVSEIRSGHVFLVAGTRLPIVVHIETDAGPITGMQSELTADIAFGKGEVLEGTLVLAMLQEFSQVVGEIASKFVTAGLVK